jgi:hypothetical protein
MAHLASQDEATIDAMLARFMSGSVELNPYHPRATGLVRAIAAEVGVEIPAKFIPSAPTPEEEPATATAAA